MDYQNYQAQKQKILESQFPYKVLEKGEIGDIAKLPWMNF